MTGGVSGVGERRRARAVVLIVLDSVGIGDAPDAAEFGDEGSATLPNLARAVGGIRLPGLASLGLGRLAPVEGVPPIDEPGGAFGRMTERSLGKDTTTGHWEIAGVVLDRAFPLYPQGFPPEVMEPFERAIGSGTLGNVAASGTEIIDRLGAEHMATGKPIVYTSGDSVFQIAAHVDVVPMERLYQMCRTARGLLRGPHEVGRVIARPFEGVPGSFRRTGDRHDYSVPPPHDTVLDEISRAGLEVRAVGKISDIFGGRGVTASHPTGSNEEGVDAVLQELGTINRGLVWANLVDFDQSFGHRNDAEGYARALESFDRRLPHLLEALGPEDILIVTADHGNDPPPPPRITPGSESRSSAWGHRSPLGCRWGRARRSPTAEPPSPTSWGSSRPGRAPPGPPTCARGRGHPERSRRASRRTMMAPSRDPAAQGVNR